MNKRFDNVRYGALGKTPRMSNAAMQTSMSNFAVVFAGALVVAGVIATMTYLIVEVNTDSTVNATVDVDFVNTGNGTTIGTLSSSSSSSSTGGGGAGSSSSTAETSSTAEDASSTAETSSTAEEDTSSTAELTGPEESSSSSSSASSSSSSTGSPSSSSSSSSSAPSSSSSSSSSSSAESSSSSSSTAEDESSTAPSSSSSGSSSSTAESSSSTSESSSSTSESSSSSSSTAESSSSSSSSSADASSSSSSSSTGAAEESSSSSSTSDAEESSSSSSTAASRRLLQVGHSGRPQAAALRTDIHSLQYYPTAISLCESIEFSGTAYSNPEGCWAVYTSATTANESFYESFGVAEALAAGPEGWIDLMRGVTSLGGATITSEDIARTYNYVIIGWLMPIKMNATLTTYLGDKLYTKPGAYNSTILKTITTSDMAVGPPEMAAAGMNNGGSWARLAQPFKLSSGAWTVTLAFNPDNIVFGDYDADECGRSLCDEDHHGIDFPFIAMNPVVHKVGDAVYKETYRVHVPDPEYDVRHELYYVASAPEEVRAVDSALWWTAANAGQHLFPPSQSFDVQTNGTHWDFMSWGGAPVIGEFVRLSEVGDTGVAVMGCFHGSCAGNHSDPNPTSPTVPVTYELVSVVQVA